MITDGSKVGYNNAALQINRTQKVQKEMLQQELDKQSAYVDTFNASMTSLNFAVEQLTNAIGFLDTLIRNW